MGYAIARAAVRAGHSVHLVTGPVALATPPNVNLIRVTGTEQMYQAAARLFPKADCLIGAAAPADFAPVRRVRGKQKKTGKTLLLRLKPTTDVLGALGKKRRNQVVIAFALEAQSPIRNALSKMKKKGADAIVVNTPAAMGAVKSSVTILTSYGARMELRNATKNRIAAALVALAERLHGGKI